MGRDGRGVRAASGSSIEISFAYRGERCRERIPLKPTPANLKRAEQHRGAVLHAIATGSFDYAATFPESKNPMARTASTPAKDALSAEKYLEEWLSAKKKHLAASTFAGYSSIVNNRLVPAFRHLLLAGITRREIKKWLDEYGIDSPAPVTNKRLANIQSCLRSALDDALTDELIEVNPMAGWVYRRKEQLRPETDVDPFTPDEQKAILAALPADLSLMMQFAFWTGVRTSELIALEWGDVDFLRGNISVRRGLTRAAKGRPEVTKTRAGKREIKLLAPALAVITHQKGLTYVGGSGVIFQNPADNTRWTDSQIYRNWGRALKRAGVRYRRPYQTRHTYASMMLSAREHPMWVAGQMGHSDWTMIAKVYGKWMPTADSSAGERAVEAFGMPPTGKSKILAG